MTDERERTWMTFGPGERVPCPGPRDHLGRRAQQRPGTMDRRATCNRTVFNEVGAGIWVRLRIVHQGRSDPERMMAGRCPVEITAGCTMRFCSECHAWLEIRVDPMHRVAA